MQFGNVFIGVQPSFGYEGDPIRLLFAKSASPRHGLDDSEYEVIKYIKKVVATGHLKCELTVFL